MSAPTTTASATTTASLITPDILVNASTPGRWAFIGATDAGRDYVAALGAFGGGEVGLPPALGERFIASARAAGMTLAEATAPVTVATGEVVPATMPRIERVAVAAVEAVVA